MFNPTQILCKYFAAGNCSRSNCYFSHDLSSPSGNICQYYLYGTCFFADNCRFEHVDIIDFEKPPRVPITITDPSLPLSSQTEKHAGPREESAIDVGPTDTTTNTETQEEPSSSGQSSGSQRVDVILSKTIPFCQFGCQGLCPLLDCPLRHGDVCETCLCQVLDPLNAEQRTAHEKACGAVFERDMEHAFALQRSSSKQCSVCLDQVLTKADPKRRRFGILEKCPHIVCFDCIMMWRKQGRDDIASQTARSCPVCRTHSDFAIPCTVCPETPEEKEKLIKEYKEEMSRIPCKHFKGGRGRCPFGGMCWFMHRKADGTIVKLPLPRPRKGMTARAALADFAAMADFLAPSDDEFDGDDDFDGDSVGDMDDDYNGLDDEDQFDIDLIATADHNFYHGIFNVANGADVGPGEWPVADHPTEAAVPDGS